jgi:anaerobic magnesium-protoporphyrin IX monomethyl ester cyclase
MNCVDAILVGRRLPDNENLGIGYLLASLEAAGLRGRMGVLNSWTDLEGLSRQILDMSPALVGLSMPDGGSAFLFLGLGELLRRRGYRGHITAGGPFATLARHWLLGRCSWLDSVVRFAGEVPLPMLVRRVQQGGGGTGIPGVTTGQGDGPPAPVMDRTPIDIFPVRGEMPTVLGRPMAHMAATRGCPGRCAYCGPSAIRRLEWQEGLEAGFSTADLQCEGVARVRRRPPESLCDEMALLWHERHVRYFYFVDEHVLPRRREDALAWIAAVKQGLQRRGVGALGLGCMLRADLLDAEVARAFADLGLVRCFLGIEFASPQELRLYGRGGSLARGTDMMAGLQRSGVATICNLMLVHPYSTMESIRGALDFLEGLGSAPFEAVHMQVYHGTRLHERLSAEARVTGNPLRYGYTFDDPAVGRFSEIFARLRGEAFGDYSLAFKTHDVGLALGLGRRLDPSASLDGCERKCRELGARLNRLRLDAMREALAMAREGRGFHDCLDLVDRTAGQAGLLSAELERLAGRILSAPGRGERIFSPMRAAAAAVISFCLAGAPLPGCKTMLSETPRSFETGTEKDREIIQAEVGVLTTAQAAADASSEPGSMEAPAAAEAAPEPAAAKTYVEAPEPCTEEASLAVTRKVKKIVKKAEPCGDIHVSFDWETAGLYAETQWAYDTRPCSPDDAGMGSLEEKLEAGLSRDEIDCLAFSSVYVPGKRTDQAQKLVSSAFQKCPAEKGSAYWYSLMVEVDGNGKVMDIRPRKDDDQIPPDAIECLKKALKGLSFPCLAGYRICPEYVIIE